MKLNEIRDNDGARKSRRRVGRGIGSGRGKTSGRGVKGQKARTGVSINGFEGGQMPIHRRVPKRGFNNPSIQHYAEVTPGRLQKAVDSGRLDAAKPVDFAALAEAGLVKNMRDGVRLIGGGEIKAKLTLTVTGATKSAKAVVEAAGGKVNVLILPKAERPPRHTRGRRVGAKNGKTKKAGAAAAAAPTQA
jgi:large subunit ribosomal protein L15